MKNLKEAQCDIFLPDGMRNSIDQTADTDYTEEAIPERDPACRLPYGTLSETQTIEQVSAARRLDLARCLEQLGMSSHRAALMASL